MYSLIFPLEILILIPKSTVSAKAFHVYCPKRFPSLHIEGNSYDDRVDWLDNLFSLPKVVQIVKSGAFRYLFNGITPSEWIWWERFSQCESAVEVRKNEEKHLLKCDQYDQRQRWRQLKITH